VHAPVDIATLPASNRTDVAGTALSLPVKRDMSRAAE
jgi:hypothetical protein